MGMSETIVAAMIGAIATVSTALFQLFTALRSRAKVDARPKRGATARSILAVLVLMLASAAGGFLYSELMKQRAGEDMRAMRQELLELKQLTTRVAELRSAALPQPIAPAASLEVSSAALTAQPQSSSVESIVYVPACRRAEGPCEQSDAHRIALCGSVPTRARVLGVDAFAQPDAVQTAWAAHRVAFEQDLGGARFTGKSFEYASGAESKAVCVHFEQWSGEHPYIARILIHYDFSAAPAITTPAAPIEDGAAPPAVIAADMPAAIISPVSLRAPEPAL